MLKSMFIGIWKSIRIAWSYSEDFRPTLSRELRLTAKTLPGYPGRVLFSLGIFLRCPLGIAFIKRLNETHYYEDENDESLTQYLQHPFFWVRRACRAKIAEIRQLKVLQSTLSYGPSGSIDTLSTPASAFFPTYSNPVSYDHATYLKMKEIGRTYADVIKINKDTKWIKNLKLYLKGIKFWAERGRGYLTWAQSLMVLAIWMRGTTYNWTEIIVIGGMATFIIMVIDFLWVFKWEMETQSDANPVWVKHVEKQMQQDARLENIEKSLYRLEVMLNINELTKDKE